jgi:hypothetical protein
MKRFAVGLVVVGMLVAFLAASSSFAADKPTTLKGTVAEVKGSVVSVKDKDGKKVKFDTDDKTEVLIEGKKSKVSALNSGMEVTVTPPKGLATRIEVTKK